MKQESALELAVKGRRGKKFNPRSQLSIQLDMLTLAQEPLTRAEITRRANLWHHQWHRDIKLLLEKGLIEKEGKYYRTTARGRLFLELLA